MRLKRHLLPCLALLAMLLQTSCGGRSERAAMLERADSLMSVSPSLALGFTDSLLAVGEGSRHWQSQLQLRRLNAQNKLDTVFTRRHVDEAKTLVEHFDRHGTPNERMLAHYLLGRTYADTHEAPMAIEAYKDAVDCADTTATDCDYRQLCFVYTQMAAVLYSQNLYRDELECLDHAIDYGYRASDTLNALLAYTQKTGAYDMLMKPDSMLYVSETVSELFRHSGYKNLSAAVLFSPILHLVNIGELNKARHFLDSYEHESGYFDTNSNIEQGREIYYYTKGTFHVAVHQYDSAEYYFRKELRDGRDFNNQNAGARGLAQLFMITHQPDSAAKYALYSYAMNDSTYDNETTSEVAKVKALYDYSRFQREAQQEKERADKENRRFLYACALVFLILLVVAVLSYLYRQQMEKRKKEEKEYQKLLMKQQQTEYELRKLRTHESEFQKLISEKEHFVQQQKASKEELDQLRKSEQALKEIISNKEEESVTLQAELAQYKQNERLTRQRTQTLKDRLYGLETYKTIRHKADNGKPLTPEDWTILIGLVDELTPEYSHFLTQKSHLLTERERQVCIMIRLYFSPKCMANVLETDKSIVTRMRAGLHQKLFDMPGTSRDLDQKLLEIL